MPHTGPRIRILLPGARCLRSGLPRLWAHDDTSATIAIAAFIRSRALWIWSASSITAPTHLPGALQDQEPRDRNHHRPARMGNRLGRLLLDRPSAVFAALVDPPDPCELDERAIELSETPSRSTFDHYQVMIAARQQDPEELRRQYESVGEIILSIDGLQPEKGHETLYVVRELTQKRVWFAEPLISATADEVRRLIAKAKEWAESLGKPVALWLSDKQDAFVTGNCGGVSRHTASLLRQPFPPRCGQASLGGRQSRQGSDAARRSAACGKLNKPYSCGRKPRTSEDLGPDDPEQPSTIIAGAANVPSSTVDSGECSGAGLLRGGAWYSQ